MTEALVLKQSFIRNGSCVAPHKWNETALRVVNCGKTQFASAVRDAAPCVELAGDAVC